jgi:hypothetical protein
VKVQTHPSAAKVYNAYGIERAGDGLPECSKSFAELALNGAEAASIGLKMTIGTFLGTGDYRSDKVSVTVNFKETLGIYCRTALFRHERGIYPIIGLQRLQFLFLEGRAAVSDYAAAALAYGVVAGKKLKDDIL